MASLLLTILTFFSCSITEKEPTLDNEIVAYLGKMAELFENKDLKGQSELFAKNFAISITFPDGQKKSFKKTREQHLAIITKFSAATKNHTYSQKIITPDLLMLSFLPSVT